ncbi:hypothetical protein BJ742DRAFT_173729 [Cladochytrium replicatum]|nr:hypothetical protein BJ742DRAFT_173729 [Cladochytrium replicatum]
MDLVSSLGLYRTWTVEFSSMASSPFANNVAKSPLWPVFHPPNSGKAFTVNNASALINGTLEVQFPKGTYEAPGGGSIQGVSRNEVTGGMHFYLQPFGPTPNKAYSQVLMSYSVWFPADFPFNKGGKLPGFYAGSLDSDDRGCSGGKVSSGFDCFSVRLMWRTTGLGEAYMYISPKNGHLCVYPTVCDDQYGISLGRGRFQFVPGTWNRMAIYVKLNTPGLADGVVRIFQNDTVVIESSQILYRDVISASNSAEVNATIPDNYDPDLLVPTTMMMSTFFGGNSPSWGAPKETYLLLSNLSLNVPGDKPTSSTNDTNTTPGGPAASAATIIHLKSILVAYFIASIILITALT